MTKQILIDGQTYPVVVAVNEDGSPIGGGSGGSGAGGIIGVDANGTQWIMISDTKATPATITYFKVSNGTTGAPVGGFTPDADQNGATAALQTAGNTSLASIDADLGATADAAATTDTGTFSLIALVKRGLQNWTTLLARVPTLGQKAASVSAPVVIASDQSVVRVLSSVPNASSGTILGLTTSATGTTYTAFGSQACTGLDVVNNTGTTIEYRRGGAGTAMQIPTGTARIVIGITNANQVDVRRTDTSNTQVTLQAEAFVNLS